MRGDTVEWFSSNSDRPKIGQFNETQNVVLLDLCSRTFQHRQTDRTRLILHCQPQHRTCTHTVHDPETGLAAAMLHYLVFRLNLFLDIWDAALMSVHVFMFWCVCTFGSCVTIFFIPLILFSEMSLLSQWPSSNTVKWLKQSHWKHTKCILMGSYSHWLPEWLETTAVSSMQLVSTTHTPY